MAVQVPTVVLPRKVAGVARSQTNLSGRDRGETLRADNNPDLNQAISYYRGLGTATAQLRSLYLTDGLLGTSILSLVRIANSGLNFSAYETGTHEFSKDGLIAVESIVSSMDTLWDYTQGYSDKQTLENLTEQLLLEAALTGGVAAELILNKQRLPERLGIFPYDTIVWKADGKGGRIPTQRRNKPKPGQEQEISLDYPNVWVAETVKSADQTYATSIMVSAIKRLTYYDEFIEDMRRVIRQHGSPRLLVSLDYDKVKSSAPVNVQTDPEKLAAYMETVRNTIEDQVKDLEPQDSLVYYNMVEVGSVKAEGEKKDYKDLLDALSGLTASSMKANPSILGLRLGGSQNVASTESMLFTHIAGVLQIPVQNVISRALTLAVRLLGVDVYVKAEFKPIDLRPEMELEGHKAILQRRVMSLLSTGRITDDEAQAMLGLGSLPEGAPPLSGTFFYENNSPEQVMGVRDEPNGREIAPERPESEGGEDNERRP